MKHLIFLTSVQLKRFSLKKKLSKRERFFNLLFFLRANVILVSIPSFFLLNLSVAYELSRVAKRKAITV